MAVAVSIAQASIYSSYSTPSLGTSICCRIGPRKGKKTKNKNPTHFWGVPVMAQWLMNLTRNHEVEGSIPGLTQWVKDLALPFAMV